MKVVKIKSKTQVPEIALCNLAGIIVGNMDINDDEQYAKTAYYALRMIDKTIHLARYYFKALEDTAKARMNAGVGILGLAHLMAKHHKKYDNQEGLNFIHELFETHMWHLLNASLKLGQERGNAPWMHKTKWVDGYLPIDTYERRVDSLVTVPNKRNWPELRARIKANKGLRFSVHAAHMPGESSTIGAGTTNGVYPIRDFDLLKTNDTLAIHYVAPDSTKLRKHYQIAWDIPSSAMIKAYAVMQKWTDQGISADLYYRVQGEEKLSTGVLLDDWINCYLYGLKSRYYVNSLTGKGLANSEPVAQVAPEVQADDDADEADCESCKL